MSDHAPPRVCRECGCTDEGRHADRWPVPRAFMPGDDDLCAPCAFGAPPPRAAFAGAGAVGFVRRAGGARSEGPA